MTEEGLTPERIVEELTTIRTIDVHAALVYYNDHKAEVDADFEEDAKLSEQGEREAEDPSRRRSCPAAFRSSSTSTSRCP